MRGKTNLDEIVDPLFMWWQPILQYYFSNVISIICIGTLDGFTFDSDEEGDKLPESQPYQNDQNNEDDGQPKAKTKRKAEKQEVCFLDSTLVDNFRVIIQFWFCECSKKKIQLCVASFWNFYVQKITLKCSRDGSDWEFRIGGV